jgi:hypothetical protein
MLQVGVPDVVVPVEGGLIDHLVGGQEAGAHINIAYADQGIP